MLVRIDRFSLRLYAQKKASTFRQNIVIICIFCQQIKQIQMAMINSQYPAVRNANITVQNFIEQQAPFHEQAYNIDLIPNCTNRNRESFDPTTNREKSCRHSLQEEIPWLFVQIYFMVTQLQNMRIIQKLARPVERQQKIRLINQVNRTLQNVQKKLNFIKQKSGKFSKSKGEPIKISYQKQTILLEEQIYPTRWKDGLRKVHVKINNFYKQRLQKLEKINEALGERFIVKKIDIEDWFKQCMKKMKGFCWCG